MKIDLNKRKLPEANIQAEIYHQCKSNKINCILGYKLDRVKFDVLIYDNDFNVLCIVEVKSYKRLNKKPKVNTIQMNKYREHRKPVYLITRIEQVSEFIEYLKKDYKTSITKDTVKQEINSERMIDFNYI